LAWISEAGDVLLAAWAGQG